MVCIAIPSKLCNFAKNIISYITVSVHIALIQIK